MKTARQKILISIVLLSLSFGLFTVNKNILAGQELSQQLKGRILLQVEQNGEAYYLYPEDYKKYYLGRPEDAFDIMRSLSVGITDADLNKIPVAEANFLGPDADNDGLSDAVENSFGTNPSLPDTDNDGYSDKEEILSNYNPLGGEKIGINYSFAANLAGKILLQTEKNGEAWYVNPVDNKRYFLSRPADAFSIMRKLGLGITNENLAKIDTYTDPNENYINKIVKTYTKIIPSSDSREYKDPNFNFTLEYPKSWHLKKYEDNNTLVQFTNAEKDYIMEKKALITLNYIISDEISDISDFRIASKDISKTLSDQEKTINEFKAYENSYKHPITNEKTTTLHLRGNNYLQITLAAPESAYGSSLDIYDNLVGSIKLAD